jgi:hypothetical protein
MQKDMDVLKMQFQHYHESMETIESDLKTFQDLFAFMKSQDWSQRLNEFSKGMSHLKENSPEQKPKASSIKPEPEQRPKRKINPKTKRGENS